MLECVAFLSCLEFAVLNSVYKEGTLKPKQVLCLERMYLEKDTICVLPTGYGKSLVFHLLPWLLFAKFKLSKELRLPDMSTAAVQSIVIVVSPLNALMSDQISRLKSSGIKASVINIEQHDRDQQPRQSQWEEADDGDFDDPDDNRKVEINFDMQCEERKLRTGQYNILFAHPEALVSVQYARNLC